VRGVATDPERVVFCAGYTQAVTLLVRALVRTADGGVTVAVEDPGLPGRDAIVTAAGACAVALPVDDGGLDPESVIESGARAVIVTPAHQYPTGVALDPSRRAALADWASAGGLVIEDDYDAEFRYDRAPIGALQGLAAEAVAYVGTASKTLAPALRLGWLVLPPSLEAAVVEEKRCDDGGSSVLEPFALARLIETGAYDRHLRRTRRSYRSRRDALIRALARHIPEARVGGLAAGLHAMVDLPPGTAMPLLLDAAGARGLELAPISRFSIEPAADPCRLVVGYAQLPEPALERAIRLLAACVREARQA
jgi:GntR family transcriptional regulator/MocR family aminotransferase